MKREKKQITVLDNFDGFVETAKVIEVIKRYTIRRYVRQYDFQRKVYYYSKLKPLQEVCYKNKKYMAFCLPKLGLCISTRSFR